MSLEAFQRAMSDLVASADLCNRLLREPESVLSAYDLTPRERRRLESAVGQRGMAVNCSLYRANRITPIYNYLPYTCFLLGDELMPTMLAFWEAHRDAQPQFRKEIEKFGEFLRGRADSVPDSVLCDALEFELAVNSLRFTTKREQAAHPHPRLRVVRLRHDPELLLKLLADKSPPPYGLPEGEFWLLVDGTGESIEARSIDPDEDDLDALADAGLIV